MALKKHAKRFVLRILEKILICIHKLVGPPHILVYSLNINLAMLKAFGATVGKNVRVYPPVALHNISKGYGNLTIGDDCVIHANTYLDLTARITLEDGVSLAPGTIIMTHNRYNFNPFLEEALPHTCGQKDVVIKKGSGIKAGALITMGMTVGENSVVAGGAVINRSVGDRVFVGGVPGRVIKTINPPKECPNDESGQ